MQIPELDIQYAHLQSVKASLLRAAQAKLGDGDSELDERFDAVKKALRSAESLIEVNDVQALLTYEVDEADVSGGAAEEAAVAAEAAAAGGTGKARKARRPTKRGLYYMARRGKASILSEKLGLPVRLRALNRTAILLSPFSLPLTPHR